MKSLQYIKHNYYKFSIDIIRIAPVLFVLFCIIFMLLRYPEASAKGASSGLELCLGTLVPTLYPFLVVSTLTTEINIPDRLLKLSDKVTMFLFKVDGICLGTVVLSMIGGMPVGCKMASELYLNGSISRSMARRLMLFCFCCGPAFTISSVGIFMLSSKEAGIVIYLSLILSALVVGILSRFFEEEDNIYSHKTPTCDNNTFSQCMVKAVSTGTASILGICSWVILFSCINELIKIIPLSDSAKLFISCILEVTNGTKSSAGHLQLPLIAGIISFGGLCSHCQVMPYIIKVGMKYKYFLVSRIICGALSVIFCNLLLECFPVAYDVFSMGTLPSETASGLSVSLSVAMMFMAGLFLLGDKTVIHIKKDHRN